MLILQALHLLILPSSQFLVKLLNFLPNFLPFVPQHLSTQTEEGSLGVARPDIFDNPEEIFASFDVLDNDSSVLQPTEGLLNFAINHPANCTDGGPVIGIHLEDLPIPHFLELLHHQLEVRLTLAHHEGSQQSNGSASLFLQGLLQVLHFLLFGYYCGFSHFLEAVPFSQVILLLEDVLNRTFHPFLDLEPLVGDEFNPFPAGGQAVVV